MVRWRESSDIRGHDPAVVTHGVSMLYANLEGKAVTKRSLRGSDGQQEQASRDSTPQELGKHVKSAIVHVIALARDALTYSLAVCHDIVQIFPARVLATVVAVLSATPFAMDFSSGSAASGSVPVVSFPSCRPTTARWLLPR